jgi:hypothetical protein
MGLIGRIVVCIISCLFGIAGIGLGVTGIFFVIDNFDLEFCFIAYGLACIAAGLLACCLGICCFIFGFAFLFNSIC